MKKNEKQTVQNRIFYTNTAMIFVIITICALIGAACVKIYWESVEQILHAQVGKHFTNETEQWIEQLTLHNGFFNGMLLVFTILSIVTLVLVCRYFTMRLRKKIMEPLEQLEAGAQRIRQNDYSTPIVYHGDAEFESLCETFNHMQKHLLDEKEKNAKYEKARQEMIAGISHDLRSPLTAIRGSVKGILDGVVADPDQQTRFLQTAYRRSGEMDQLLNELFYFSKLETGGIPVQIQSLDLVDYMQNYFHAKQEEMPAIHFICDLPAHPVEVMADPEALQRILDNVLVNSKKYANVPSLSFYVGIQDHTLILQDNGVGVPEKTMDRIFDEFYRADPSRSQKEGSGLGLYIVKYLMDAMQGSVSADVQSHHADFHGLAIVLKWKEGEKHAATNDTDH
ncbi:HAMP domain-containing sensor histidine kinase [Absicoccus intestinalis]|jgi:signal transduction histidine kinase|uniref:histidine kinase n=1 Tax=Absicoccus intestinalis TaxID=2926319 RepID=A0ABU4WM12_9FIRM|nr:HAMP domain-containing sensor histidine kinase [Absicoccus sp. CLA-KB-P134]MDX8417603.1 HAMP domain-containing histidine kinase [Absicoccus sp. CLA-KB-P134]